MTEERKKKLIYRQDFEGKLYFPSRKEKKKWEKEKVNG